MAKSLNSHAVLFKAGFDESKCHSDPYVEELKMLGITSHLVPVINFEFINTDELRLKLDQPEVYDGIIFSSPRCVEAVKLCMQDCSAWKNHKAYVVGDKTSNDVLSMLKMTPEGKSCGSGQNLAEFILSQCVTKPLLLPAGNISTNVIFDNLIEGGLEVDQIIVYKTVSNPNLKQILPSIFTKNYINYMLYFSPSGIDSTVPLLKEMGVDTSKIKLGAIGPTTAVALDKHGLKASFVADHPTPSSFAKALKKIL